MCDSETVCRQLSQVVGHTWCVLAACWLMSRWIAVMCSVCYSVSFAELEKKDINIAVSQYSHTFCQYVLCE